MTDFVKFKFLENPKDNDNPFDITDFEDPTEPGIMYWRQDLIVGYCSGIDKNETHIIVGISDDGARMQFKVNEPIAEVNSKLNDSG